MLIKDHFMNKKLFALLCISFLGNIHALQENCQQNYITSTAFPIKNMETIKFSNNGDITFSSNAVLADFHNLKTLGFNNNDVKIVTANGMRYPKTLNPHEDLGAPVNCMVLLNSDIQQQVNDTYTVTEINPDNLTSIEINNHEHENIHHVQDTASQTVKRDPKVAESINSIIHEITTTLDEGINDDLALFSSREEVENTTDTKIRCCVRYSNSIECALRKNTKLETCYYKAFYTFWKNFDLLEKHYAKDFAVLKDTDIVKQKFDKICLAINHCKVLVNSVIIGNYRISFSRAFPNGRLGAIDNMLPIDNEQCRARIFYFVHGAEASGTTAKMFSKIQAENNIQVEVLFPQL